MWHILWDGLMQMLQTGILFIHNKLVPDSSIRDTVKPGGSKHSRDELGNSAPTAELRQTSISKHAVNLLSGRIAFYAINASLTD